MCRPDESSRSSLSGASNWSLESRALSAVHSRPRWCFVLPSVLLRCIDAPTICCQSWAQELAVRASGSLSFGSLNIKKRLFAVGQLMDTRVIAGLGLCPC